MRIFYLRLFFFFPSPGTDRDAGGGILSDIFGEENTPADLSPCTFRQLISHMRTKFSTSPLSCIRQRPGAPFDKVAPRKAICTFCSFPLAFPQMQLLIRLPTLPHLVVSRYSPNRGTVFWSPPLPSGQAFSPFFSRIFGSFQTVQEGVLFL